MTREIDFTEPEFPELTQKLVAKMRRQSLKRIKSLMNLSDNLARLNQKRFLEFADTVNGTGKPCVFMFQGDVYQGLSVNDFSDADIEFAQSHLCILSGLYGILRPLDRIQPYRLEMGTAIAAGRKKNLYEYWSPWITNRLNSRLGDYGEPVLINLASNEYFKAINQKQLAARVVTPAFKEERDGEYVMISFFAKKARGLMSRYIIQNRLSRPNDILSFDLDGYALNRDLSTVDQPVFTRKSA